MPPDRTAAPVCSHYGRPLASTLFTTRMFAEGCTDSGACADCHHSPGNFGVHAHTAGPARPTDGTQALKRESRQFQLAVRQLGQSRSPRSRACPAAASGGSGWRCGSPPARWRGDACPCRPCTRRRHRKTAFRTVRSLENPRRFAWWPAALRLGFIACRGGGAQSHAARRMARKARGKEGRAWNHWRPSS